MSCSFIAAWAPPSPLSTITCKRALRLAVSAISDMAKKAVEQNQEYKKGNVHGWAWQRGEAPHAGCAKAGKSSR